MIGELRCLNCSRHLADVVHGTSGRVKLVAPGGDANGMILVAKSSRGLRCTRCGGRPLLETMTAGEAMPTRGERRGAVRAA